MSTLLVYGSYGFVGSLVTREALDRGIDVVLAGRDGGQLDDQVSDLGRPAVQFSADEPSVIVEALEDIDCLLNCAGPFSNTAPTLVEACLEGSTDYVDITGEIPVIEWIKRRDAEATDREVTLLPAAGFSAVPMDCLGAHLADRFPDANALSMGVDSFRVPSIGSLRTVIEGIETGGAVYQEGELEYVPAAWRTRRIDFGRGSLPAVTMPMGDVSTAHETTGIPTVEVYAVMPQPARLVLKAHRYLAPILASRPVKRLLKGAAGLVREGPSERARERGGAYIWGEARGDGRRAVSRLQTPDPYVVTVDAAVTAAERVLEGDAGDGYRTPAGAFGPEFVFDLDDVKGFFDEPMQRRVGELPVTT